MPGGGLRTAEALGRRAVNRDLSISDDSEDAHRVRCCEAVGCVIQAITVTPSIVVDESAAPKEGIAAVRN